MIRRLVVLTVAAVALLAVVGTGRFAITPVDATAPYVGAVAPAPQPLACPGTVEVPVGDLDSTDPDLAADTDERTYRTFGDGRRPAGAGFLVAGEVGAAVESVAAGDVAGLSAAACASPVREQWLVGGSTALGSSARLVLTNPSDASTEATVTLYGGLGAIEERAVISIAGGGQQDLLLEAIAPEVPALVVHVVATGAGVAAHLQDSRLDGFQPAGTDWVGRGASPARSLVVPGVGAEEGATVTLRLMAPEGATAALALAGDTGDIPWGGVGALVLEPGVVTEVAVPSTASGAVEIEADAPVVAAALRSVPRPVIDGPAGAIARDLAWMAAQDVTDGRPRSVVATDGVATVAVRAGESGEFTLTDASGAVVASARLSRGATATLPLDVPPGTVLTGSTGAAWVLVLAGPDGFTATLSPRRTDVEILEVEVRTRPYVGQAS